MPGSGKQQSHGFGQIQGFGAVEFTPRHSLPGKHRQTRLGGTWALTTSNTAKVSRCPTAMARLMDSIPKSGAELTSGEKGEPTTARREGVPPAPATCPPTTPHPPGGIEVQEGRPGASPSRSRNRERWAGETRAGETAKEAMPRWRSQRAQGRAARPRSRSSGHGTDRQRDSHRAGAAWQRTPEPTNQPPGRPAA